jgi:hypothetical protein
MRFFPRDRRTLGLRTPIQNFVGILSFVSQIVRESDLIQATAREHGFDH